MVQLPPWTDEVSDLVLDAQVIAMRAVNEDGVLTPTEQALLDALKSVQETITEVDDEITAMTSTLRSGRRPRRYRCAPTDQTAA